MPTDTTTRDITDEIRGLFDTQVGHFADKSARWLFRQKENVRGLIISITLFFLSDLKRNVKV